MSEQIEAAPLYASAPRSEPALAGRALDPTALRAERDRVRRARAAYAAKLSRLRFYSYCLTLTACVLALLSFMYLAQGTADGDATFVWLGTGFVAATVTALWSALRITHVAEFPAA